MVEMWLWAAGDETNRKCQRYYIIMFPTSTLNGTKVSFSLLIHFICRNAFLFHAKTRCCQLIPPTKTHWLPSHYQFSKYILYLCVSLRMDFILCSHFVNGEYVLCIADTSKPSIIWQIIRRMKMKYELPAGTVAMKKALIDSGWRWKHISFPSLSGAINSLSDKYV